jgi:hypothetical protein
LWWCSPMMARSSWASYKSNPPSRLPKIIFDFLWIAGCFRQQLKQPWPEQHTTRRLRVSCTLLYSIVEIFGRREKIWSAAQNSSRSRIIIKNYKFEAVARNLPVFLNFRSGSRKGE